MEEYDLKDLFNMFWKRKFIIFTVVILFLIAGALYSYKFVKPKYTSYSTILLTQLTNTTSENETSTTEIDLKSNARLVATYRELIKSNIIIREVLDKLDIKDLTESYLKSSINVSSVGDSDMIKIFATTDVPEYAEKIANTTAEVFCNRITDFYKINNLKIVDRAEVGNIPSNIHHAKDLLIFVLLGFVVSFGYILLLDTFKK